MKNTLDEKGFLQSILNRSKNAIILLSSKLLILEFNSSAENIYSLKKKEILNKNFINLCRSKNLNNPIIEKASYVLSGQSFIDLEETISKQNFEPIYLGWNISPLLHNKGDATGVMLIGEDITQLRIAEIQEQTVRIQLGNIISHIPGFIFWKDRNLRIMGCNANFAKIAGETTQSIIGKTDFDLPWAKNEAEAFRRDDKEVIESRIPKLNIEEPMRQADGSERTLITNKVPLRDLNGNTVGVIGIFTDITERKLAEKELLWK